VPTYHNESIDHGDVVSHPSIRSVAAGDLQVGPQLRQEGDGGPVLQVAVQVLLEAGLDQSGEVSHHARGDRDLRQHVHLELRSERIRKPHVP